MSKKTKFVRNDYRNAEIIANWILRFDGDETKFQTAEKLCVLNGMQPGELKEIIEHDYINRTYSELLEINHIINHKRKTPSKKEV